MTASESKGVVIRDYRDDDADQVFKLWREGFYEMRDDGFEMLSRTTPVHVFTWFVSSCFWYFIVGFPLSLATSLPLLFILLDIYNKFKIYSIILSHVHGVIFW